MSKTAIAVALTAALSFAALPAHAGLFDDDEARKAILDLRTKVGDLQQELNTKLPDKADKSAMLDLLNQNEQLRQQVARLQGQIEVLTNDLAETQKRQKDFYADLDTRLQKVEPQSRTVNGQETQVDPGESRAYDNAQALFKNGDYKGAATALQDFLRRYPGSAFSADAQYTLGNSLYLQNDYKGALAAQQVVVRNYADSPKAPEALLSIATCYVELKDKAGAKRALTMLVDKYGDSAQAPTAKERLKALK
ncbi:MAG: tol-pal system protein YbgF [Burkholderiaceae bacterium]|nr:tol-pal system protein YbgF [Burkholderiaceae bacterium]